MVPMRSSLSGGTNNLHPRGFCPERGRHNNQISLTLAASLRHSRGSPASSAARKNVQELRTAAPGDPLSIVIFTVARAEIRECKSCAVAAAESQLRQFAPTVCDSDMGSQQDVGSDGDSQNGYVD